MKDRGYEYIRFIDDYEFYTTTMDRAEKFIASLSEELFQFRLGLNVKKTEIVGLPQPVSAEWLREVKLAGSVFDGNTRLRSKDIGKVKSFIDSSVATFQNHNNSAILRYAIKMLLKYTYDKRVFVIFEKYFEHLVLSYPYLADLVEDVYDRDESSIDRRYEIAEMVFREGLKRKYHGVISRAVFYAIKHRLNVKYINLNIDNVLKCSDCVSIVVLLYYMRMNLIPIDGVVGFAKNIISNGLVDEYWLLIYEMYRLGLVTIFKDDYEFVVLFEEMKKDGISFVKREYH